MSQQDKPLEDAQKVQAQLNALAVGTLKLSQNGDKNAQSIIARMKQLGITVAGNPADKAAPAAKAMEPTAPAPAADTDMAPAQ